MRERCCPLSHSFLSFDEFLFEHGFIFRKRFGRKEGFVEIQVAGRPALFLTKISDIFEDGPDFLRAQDLAKGGHLVREGP